MQFMLRVNNYIIIIKELNNKKTLNDNDLEVVCFVACK
jgi:hypothetical protein